MQFVKQNFSTCRLYRGKLWEGGPWRSLFGLCPFQAPLAFFINSAQLVDNLVNELDSLGRVLSFHLTFFFNLFALKSLNSLSMWAVPLYRANILTQVLHVWTQKIRKCLPCFPAPTSSLPLFLPPSPPRAHQHNLLCLFLFPMSLLSVLHKHLLMSLPETMRGLLYAIIGTVAMKLTFFV